MKQGWAYLPDKTNVISVGRQFTVIRQPVITEKSTNGGMNNQYTFEVAPDATKIEIKQAVEAVFKVKVESVNTLNQIGKVKRFKGRLGQRKSTKKAIVRLANGHTIDTTAGA